MRLIDDAGRVAREAWSMWGVYVTVALGAIDQGLYLFAPAERSPTWGLLVMVTGAATGLARVWDQGLNRGK